LLSPTQDALEPPVLSKRE